MTDIRPDILTRFKIGNKDAEKWTEEEVLDKLEEMYDNSSNDDNILCFKDACISVGYRDSHIDYFFKKFPVFEFYKKDIQSVIVSRINRNALRNKFNATAAIWRMKQLGEKDTAEVKQTNVNYNAELTKEEIKDISDTLEDEV